MFIHSPRKPIALVQDAGGKRRPGRYLRRWSFPCHGLGTVVYLCSSAVLQRGVVRQYDAVDELASAFVLCLRPRTNPLKASVPLE